MYSTKCANLIQLFRDNSSISFPSHSFSFDLNIRHARPPFRTFSMSVAFSSFAIVLSVLSLHFNAETFFFFSPFSFIRDWNIHTIHTCSENVAVYNGNCWLEGKLKLSFLFLYYIHWFFFARCCLMKSYWYTLYLYLLNIVAINHFCLFAD